MLATSGELWGRVASSHEFVSHVEGPLQRWHRTRPTILAQAPPLAAVLNPASAARLAHSPAPVSQQQVFGLEQSRQEVQGAEESAIINNASTVQVEATEKHLE
ncbi:hypothetical protein P4O66_013144, partial [Electrophorus voltai]